MKRTKGFCNVYSDDSHLTIRRIHCGNKRFYYRYSSGKKVTGERVIKRIRKLVVPPNWRDTVISRDSKASVQAVGYDEKGRKQYIYHDKWHEQQQVEKFERLVAFGRALPEFREYCLSAISQPSWTLERACALVCLLLDYTGARVGNTQYSKAIVFFVIKTPANSGMTLPVKMLMPLYTKSLVTHTAAKTSEPGRQVASRY